MSNKPIDKEYLTTQFVNFKNSLSPSEGGEPFKEGTILSLSKDDATALPKLGENNKWLKLDERKIYNKESVGEKKVGYIPEGTYSQEDFWNLLKQYVPRGTVRQYSGDFTIDVNEKTFYPSTNGYILVSNFYNRPTVALFFSKLKDINYKYNGFNVENVENIETTRAYILDYDESAYCPDSSYDIGKDYHYPITIRQGEIIFK